MSITWEANLIYLKNFDLKNKNKFISSHFCFKCIQKFDREGRNFVDFLDFLSYLPLFVEIHERIIHEPLSQLKDPFEDEKNVDAYKNPNAPKAKPIKKQL